MVTSESATYVSNNVIEADGHGNANILSAEEDGIYTPDIQPGP